MTTLLALDTATENCSVALLYQGEITEHTELASRNHTQRILPMIDEILVQSGLCLKQVDALVFGRGPGSFTGVRIGTGIVQGLSLGADLPVIPISNLEAMAQHAFETSGATQVLAGIDARMGEGYFAQFRHRALLLPTFSRPFSQWEACLPEQVCSPQHLLEQLNANGTLIKAESWVCVGTAWEAYAHSLAPFSLNSTVRLPFARFMLSLALAKFLQQQWQQPDEIEPIYLRNQVAWKKTSPLMDMDSQKKE